MKAVIVMTYISRQEQLNNTLTSFLQYNPDDFIVVIVDDGSPQDIILPDLPFKVDILKLTNKTWHCCCVPYNWGFHQAMQYSPERIIIQNAECQHEGDILKGAQMAMDDNYVSFACYSLARGETPQVIIKNKTATYDHESAWYNHSAYRPVAYHFCSAITTANLKKLNGFDERFGDGLAYEDDMFICQIKNLGLRIDIVDSPMVFHQWHDRPYEVNGELIQRNHDLFASLRKEKAYKSIHLFTPDL